jgi:hypothetical protein
MKSSIQFITDLNKLKEEIFALLSSETDSDILISGTFDNLIYKHILDEILKNCAIKNCRIIIPYVTSSGIISRPYINKISNLGGQIRHNGKFKTNIIVIGKYVFILSFSSKFSKEYGIKSEFECCIETDDEGTLENIYDTFTNMWNKGLPLINS